MTARNRRYKNGSKRLLRACLYTTPSGEVRAVIPELSQKSELTVCLQMRTSTGIGRYGSGSHLVWIGFGFR